MVMEWLHALRNWDGGGTHSPLRSIVYPLINATHIVALALLIGTSCSPTSGCSGCSPASRRGPFLRLMTIFARSAWCSRSRPGSCCFPSRPLRICGQCRSFCINFACRPLALQTQPSFASAPDGGRHRPRHHKPRPQGRRIAVADDLDRRASRWPPHRLSCDLTATMHAPYAPSGLGGLTSLSRRRTLRGQDRVQGTAMRGEVLHYDEAQGFGFITGTDGSRYTFSREDLRREAPMSKGTQVEFQPSGSQARDVFSIRTQLGAAFGNAPAGPATADARAAGRSSISAATHSPASRRIRACGATSGAASLTTMSISAAVPAARNIGAFVPVLADRLSRSSPPLVWRSTAASIIWTATKRR